MADLSREVLEGLREEFEVTTDKAEVFDVMYPHFEALISMALRKLDMQEALSGDKAEEIVGIVNPLWENKYGQALRRYANACREGK